MPTHALLIDFDGVLCRWNADDSHIELRFGLEAGAIRRVAFSSKFLVPAIEGRVTDEVWRNRVASELQRRHPAAMASRAVAQWSEAVGDIDSDVIALLSRCRGTLRVVLATNATSRLPDDLRRLGLTHRFLAIANSSDIGAAKPSAAFFAAALAKAGARAEEALFVDDSLRNVDAASALGMRAHHFAGHEGLGAFLGEAGVLASAPPGT